MTVYLCGSGVMAFLTILPNYIICWIPQSMSMCLNFGQQEFFSRMSLPYKLNLYLEKMIVIPSDMNGEKLFLGYVKLQAASSVDLLIIFCCRCLFKILLTIVFQLVLLRQCECEFYRE